MCLRVHLQSKLDILCGVVRGRMKGRGKRVRMAKDLTLHAISSCWLCCVVRVRSRLHFSFTRPLIIITYVWQALFHFEFLQLYYLILFSQKLCYIDETDTIFLILPCCRVLSFRGI